MFRNSLHLNQRKPLTWQTPSTVDISCFPKRRVTKTCQRSHDVTKHTKDNCLSFRSYNSGIFTSVALPESGTSFDIKAMNRELVPEPKRCCKVEICIVDTNVMFLFPAASWTSAAESNVYERGQVINLQVSAKTRPGQQLFIQSCFVSTSPEPQTKPRHALIMNKG